MIVRAIVSATTTKMAPQIAAAGTVIRLSLPSDSRTRWGTTRPTYPTDPLDATELPTSKLATLKTTNRTRETSTPRSNASRSPNINRFSERAWAANTMVPAIAIKSASHSNFAVVSDKSPSNQKVKDLIRVASINVVTKTIAEDRNVVTITPARMSRSGL